MGAYEIDETRERESKTVFHMLYSFDVTDNTDTSAHCVVLTNT